MNSERPGSTRCPWSIRKRAFVVAITIVLAASIALILIFNPLSLFYERHVSYEYTVIIEPNDSGQFAVMCPLPAGYGGTVFPDVLSSMVVVGDATLSEVITPYGDGLGIVGVGSAVITWSHNYTYRVSTQDMADHYSNLSMLDIGYSSGNALVHLEGASTNFSLGYVYEHEYGDRYAAGDKFVYRLTGNLTTGWNALSVGFTHLLMY